MAGWRRAPGWLRTAGPEPRGPRYAVGQSLIPLFLLVGVSIAMERERRQNDSLGDGADPGEGATEDAVGAGGGAAGGARLCLRGDRAAVVVDKLP